MASIGDPSVAMSQPWSHLDLLVGCSGSVVNVWQTADGTSPSLVFEDTLEDAAVSSCRWSPNRKAVAYGDSLGRIRIVSEGLVGREGSTTIVAQVPFSPTTVACSHMHMQPSSQKC